MKTTALLQFLTLILTGNLLHGQFLSNVNRTKERYQQQIAAADKIKSDGIAKLTATYEAGVKVAQDEVKRTFEPFIRAAAIRNDTDEIRALTLQMESIINPDGAVLSGQNSTSQTGNDYKQLIGKWETADSLNGYLRSFEFKSTRIVLYTYTYSTSGGGKSSQTEEFRATTKPDKIIIENKDSRMNSNTYKVWYEVKIPFGNDSVEITQLSEGSGRSSKNTFRLNRKK